MKQSKKQSKKQDNREILIQQTLIITRAILDKLDDIQIQMMYMESNDMLNMLTQRLGSVVYMTEVDIREIGSN